MMDREKLRELLKGVAPSYLVALYLVLVLALGMLISSLLLYPQELRIGELTRQLQVEQQNLTVVDNFILANRDAAKRLF